MNTRQPLERKIQIFDVTLRDGSYAINFQFTAEDTARIGGALDRAGVRWIELGHGLGLNASKAGKGQAAAEDEAYLQAAAESIKQSQWGMFFIPGVGQLEHLQLAARYGMGFVRIGTNITDVDRAEPYFAAARDLGFTVLWSAMKSYAVSAKEFAEIGARVSEWGADVIYLVDSAGCMTPDQVSAYIRAAGAVTDTYLGFHGHDNFSLAMANGLAALNSGAFFIDTSLQGIGRSAGNIITEVAVAFLQQRGDLNHIDLGSLMEIGQHEVRHLLEAAGRDPRDIYSATARFHSSYWEKIDQFAMEYGVDPVKLMFMLCERDIVLAPSELLIELCKKLQNSQAEVQKTR